MKSLMTHAMITVAALAAAAGSASAQTYKAEIPMAFRAGNTLLAPGSYDFVVQRSSGQDIVAIHSRSYKQSIMVVPTAGSDAPKAWRDAGTARISFECLGDNCTLRQLWNAQGPSTYQFPARKLSPVEHERVTVVSFGLTRTD
jgi:hypothetical protein